MKKIVLDIQSDIHAHNMERMLMQELVFALDVLRAYGDP